MDDFVAPFEQGDAGVAGGSAEEHGVFWVERIGG